MAPLVSCCCEERSKNPFAEHGNFKDPGSGQLLFRLSEGSINVVEIKGGNSDRDPRI